MPDKQQIEREYHKELILRARELRRNMTKQERLLWHDFLKNHPVKFYRQRVMGIFIVDFYCPKAKLVRVRRQAAL